MRIQDTFTTPIHGISTLAPRNRANGHAELQTNLRSDPVQKLTRRPSLVFQDSLLAVDDVNDEYKYHEYIRGAVTFTIVVNQTTGTVYSFKDGVLLDTSTTAASYLTAGDLVLRTVEDTTYILNKHTTVARGVQLDSIEKVTHVNVLTALNYGEEVTLGIGSVNTIGPLTQVTFAVPVLGDPPDYDAADQARASKAVAAGLVAELELTAWFTASYEVRVLGSSLGIYHKTDDVWVDAYIVTGQGDRSARVFGKIISDTEGLPLYAVHDTLVTVRPNPVDSAGTYYLRAERISEGGAVGTGLYLEEVVWAETRAPLETFDLDATTLPHTVTFDEDTNNFTVSADSWKDRRTGDDDSCPFPEFVGQRIIDLGQFQNRLVFISGGSVYMTETDDYQNWFKASAVKLLVTDPIGITSSAVDTQDVEHISSHNKDLMLVSPNGQFKIDGNVAVTPQSVSMPKVASYDCDTSVAPVPMGDSVMFAIRQGKSAGLLDFTTRKATQQEFGNNVSKHVVGLMAGNVTRLVGSVNSDMVAMTTSDSAGNVVYIYEMYDDTGKQVQSSWSTWEFPTDIIIVDLVFAVDTLKVITKHAGRLAVYTISLYSRATISTDEVYLDYLTTLNSTDGNTVTLPDNYAFAEGTLVVQGDSCEYPLFKVAHTIVGNTITFGENISGGVACSVYVGVPVRASYIPTRPFKRNEEGTVITNDRIRVASWGLYVVDTHEVTARILEDFSDWDDQIFSGRKMGQVSNLVGVRNAFTGDLSFSYSQDAELAKIEFFTEGYLGLTIAAISWRGQTYRTTRGL